MNPIHCNVCKGKNTVKLIDSNVLVFGSEKGYGMVYNCYKCDARVGVHKGTKDALGLLSGPYLRSRKIELHRLFDNLWKSGNFTRTGAYTWLANELKISTKNCHIGYFSEEMIEESINIILDFNKRQKTLGER